MHSRILAAAVAFLVGGCALSQSTDKVVLDYNRDFAKSRNEVLLLNVLRSAAREPLQFSTMGTVQGSVGNGGELTLPFTNLIGGPDMISPSLKITDAVNPSVSIVPLSHKEFALGLLGPIKPETVQLFIHNGWDANFLLPLVVGGVICPGDGGAGDELFLNGGEYLEEKGGKWVETALHVAFRDFFYRSAAAFAIGNQPGPEAKQRTLLLADKDALAVLKDGVGTGYAVADVTEAGSGQKQVKIRPAADTVIRGLEFEQFCRDARASGNKGRFQVARARADQAAGVYEAAAAENGDRTGGEDKEAARQNNGMIVFRSASSIIHYLGESHRLRYRAAGSGDGLQYWNADTPSELKILFRIQWGLSNDPKTVTTRFHDAMFYIPRLDLARGDDKDRTLKTLSFLDQLLALQTSESAIRGAQAVIALPQ
jgi:hypothetical protein